jgi:hypothetical protein
LPVFCWYFPRPALFLLLCSIRTVHA